MQKKFTTIRDYHIQDTAIRVEAAHWPSLRAVSLVEGNGDVTFNRTDRASLVLTLDGSKSHRTRMDGIDDPSPTQPGDLCLIPAGVALHLVWENHAPQQSSLMVEFDNALFSTYAPEIASDAFLRGHLIPANFAQRPVLGALVSLIAREADPPRARGRLFADSAMRLLALELAATAWSVPNAIRGAQARPDQRVRRAIAFIEEYFTADLSILDVAGAAGLSPTQLTRAFRASTGKTPYAYVIDRRLAHAMQLLRATALPIALVALEAGFNDQAHLTRLCRARLGQTPRQIRQG